MKPIIYCLGAAALMLSSCTKEADTIMEVVKEPEKGSQAELELQPTPDISTDYR